MLDPTYIISFVIAAILSLIGTYFIKKYSEGKKVYLKEVRDRDIHKKPVPKIGGIVVFWVFWITVFVIYFIKPKLLNFSEVKILGIDQNLLGLFVASLVWFVAGIYDDLKNLMEESIKKPIKKFTEEEPPEPNKSLKLVNREIGALKEKQDKIKIFTTQKLVELL